MNNVLEFAAKHAAWNYEFLLLHLWDPRGIWRPLANYWDPVGVPLPIVRRLLRAGLRAPHRLRLTAEKGAHAQSHWSGHRREVHIPGDLLATLLDRGADHLCSSVRGKQTCVHGAVRHGEKGGAHLARDLAGAALSGGGIHRGRAESGARHRPRKRHAGRRCYGCGSTHHPSGVRRDHLSAGAVLEQRVRTSLARRGDSPVLVGQLRACVLHVHAYLWARLLHVVTVAAGLRGRLLVFCVLQGALWWVPRRPLTSRRHAQAQSGMRSIWRALGRTGPGPPPPACAPEARGGGRSRAQTA
mmetsp:Transcript_38136/g.109083  ORF Transcript_38136/g.109083 Transcript_38136/m.109083 type:complete len:299 (-) Transcript_38136:3-899(-)